MEDSSTIPAKTASCQLTSQLPTDVSELSPVERNCSADFYTHGKQQKVVVSNHCIWGWFVTQQSLTDTITIPILQVRKSSP